MSAASNTDPRIIRLLAALKTGDADQIKALCHPDLMIEDPESLPYGGAYLGFLGMCEVSSKLFAAVSDWKCETLKIIGTAGGDDFVFLQRMTGRAARSGRPIDMSILEHYIFEEDLLIRIRPYYWDTKAMIDLLP